MLPLRRRRGTSPIHMLPDVDLPAAHIDLPSVLAQCADQDTVEPISHRC